MRRLHLIVALALVCFVLGAAVIFSTTQTSTPSRSWCDTDTWDGGNVPGAADQAVVISEVVVDCDWLVGSIRIEPGGTLRWEGDATLTVDASAGGDATGRVEVMGELEMRPSIEERHVLAFAGIDVANFVGGDDGMMTDPGGLHVMGPGELDLDGPDRTAWSRTVESLSGGDSVLSVVQADGWQIGDRLHIAPSAPGDFDGQDATIAAIDGTTITLDQPLVDDRPLIDGAGTEVLNLTRNIEIRGENGYVTVHPSAGVQHLADAGLVGLGVPGVTGRYPLHLHLQGDTSDGSTFSRLLVLGSENRGVVPHGSHGTTWTDTVVHDTRGPGFWWDRAVNRPRGNEINSTNRTVVERMVVSGTRKLVDRNDFRLAAYELNRGFDNEIRDSVAVGTAGRKDSSGFMWSEGEAVGESGVWVFEGNLAHNNARHGIFTWQNTSSPNHVISDFTAVRNGGFGASHGAYRNQYEYSGLRLIENGIGGLLIHSVSQDTSGQRFVDVHVESSPQGIVTTRHQLSPLGPTFITDPTFVDVDRPLVAGGSNQPDDIVVTGWTDCPEFTDTVHPSSVWVVDGTVCTP